MKFKKLYIGHHIFLMFQLRKNATEVADMIYSALDEDTIMQKMVSEIY
jgi:hypothetical protein